jgi:uncharacterized protein
MRRLIAIVAILIACTAQSAFAYSSPGAPQGYVNDFAKVLKPETKSALEKDLASFEKTTSNEVTVAIIPDMGGDYIENYAVKLFEEWKIGKKEKDNGILLLLSMKEHAMRIEVGYGLEGSLVDSNAQSILDKMKEPLRAGDPDTAVILGVRSIEEAVQNAYSASSDTSRSFVTDNINWIIVSIIIGLQWCAAILARSKSWWAGGVLGAMAGAGLGWAITSSALFMALTAGAICILGLIFDYIVSNTYQFHASRGLSSPWWIGGNSIGGSSGGFGGFSGGSSGGGGASGRW